MSENKARGPMMGGHPVSYTHLDYSFQKPLEYGELLMFGDMAIYTTCKNNTFNGMPLPDIWLRHGDKTMERLTDFGYEDFKGRLGPVSYTHLRYQN